MDIFKNILGQEEAADKNIYRLFWDWFLKNEKKFHQIIKEHKRVKEDFFEKLHLELIKIKEGFFFQAGMYNSDTVELVFTADGDPRNIVFIEELVAEAPQIKGWRFTALKPEMVINRVGIQIEDIEFQAENMYFYAHHYPEYPDEIDICIVHEDLNPENEDLIRQGIFIFLDNYLGELPFVNQIDNLHVVAKEEAEEELIPIAKLKDYLIWREKEFIEKYEGLHYHTDQDQFSIMEGELPDGQMIVAVINSQLLEWDRKASHPWLAIMILTYKDGQNGMPSPHDFDLLELIEKEITNALHDMDGYLNVGRQTGSNEREVYFACKEFRKPSKVFYEIQKKYEHLFEIEYEIYKDKYWQSFERFRG